MIRPSFNSPFVTLTHESYIESTIVNAVAFIIGSVNVVNERRSGWTILRIDAIDLTVAKNAPLRGGSGFTKRPPALKGKLGIIDFVNCPQDFCFMYAFLASSHYNHVEVRNRKRWVEYNCFQELYNFDCLRFPVKPSELSEFEEVNKVSICLFAAEDKEIYPMRVCHNRYPRIATLLYVQKKDSAHYIAIHDFDRLVGERSVSRHFHCMYCFSKFMSEVKRVEHMNKCIQYEPQVISFPKPESDGSPSYREFRNYQKTFKLPYIMVADLETTLEPLSEAEATVLKCLGKGTCYRKKLETMAYGVALLGPEGYYEYHDYVGPDAMYRFLRKCLELAHFVV